VEILAQSSTAFVLTHNFQGTHILGASRGRLSDSVASCFTFHRNACSVYATRPMNLQQRQFCRRLVTKQFELPLPKRPPADC